MYGINSNCLFFTSVQKLSVIHSSRLESFLKTIILRRVSFVQNKFVRSLWRPLDKILLMVYEFYTDIFRKSCDIMRNILYL